MIHYYLIHGIDATRKPFMEDQFQRYGIPADDVTWITYPNKHDPLPNVCTKPTLPKGMISCTYKHYLALKDICEKGYEHAVIMEDNIEFRDNVPNTLKAYMDEMPNDWDCVFDTDFLGKKTHQTIVKELRLYKHTYGLHHYVPYYSSSGSVYTQYEIYGASKGAHFLFLTQHAARKLYAAFLPFHESSDHHYNILFDKLRLNVYWAEPPNVHKIDRPSTWKDDIPHIPKIAWLKNNQR
jgi:GR25 family glycosyltransferase involved in LPS biosynthesis